jgi:hypothetical protein
MIVSPLQLWSVRPLGVLTLVSAMFAVPLRGGFRAAKESIAIGGRGVVRVISVWSILATGDTDSTCERASAIFGAFD